MNARRTRLMRLHAVRNVRLKLAARDLATANAEAAAAAATASRLGALRAEFRGAEGGVIGYAIKAAAATRATLLAAETRQGVRVAAAARKRAAVAGEFQRQRAGVDAVTRAVDRATGAVDAGDRS